MDFKIVVLSIACFSCLIPSTVSFNLVAAKAVASQAAQDLAAIKADTINANKAAVVKAVSDITDIAAAGLVQKGQALKVAAGSILGSLLNGAASVGSTLARAGIDMVAAKFGIISPPVPQTPFQDKTEATTEISNEKATPISSVDARSQFVYPQPVVNVAPKRSHQKINAPMYGHSGNSPIIYEIINTPGGYSGPLRFRFN